MGTTGSASDGTDVTSSIVSLIPLVSPFTVSATGDFTTAQFEKYLTWAQAELDRDDPGLSTEKYNEASALLVCDIFKSSKGAKDLKSEKIGDYSYSKDAGKTSYRVRYEEILRQFATEQPTEEQEREDLDGIPDQFQLDQEKVAEFDYD